MNNSSVTLPGAPSGPSNASRAPQPGAAASLMASDSTLQRRKIANILMWAFCSVSAVLAVIPLALVLYYVAAKGLPNINAEFFTAVQKPPGEAGGGVKHAISGTLLMIGIASCIGLPIGLFGGIYLAEFGQNRFGFAVRFAADVLNGVPSIVVGIFVYAIAIMPMPIENRHFSAWAGGLALGFMMIPTVMRTTEEIVKLVPMSLREASLALGSTRWHTVFKVVLSSAKGGVITGILLAVARVAGETAPLLFTALGNSYFSLNPNEPMASLPVTIYTSATSPDDRWNSMAWGGALVLVFIVFVLSVAARYATRGRLEGGR
jgi:phosphate transport system permease protein